MDSKLLTLEDAAPLAGLDPSHLARLARDGRIPGAVKREHEGARGRWYVPRSWIEARATKKSKAERVRDLAASEPDLSRRAIAERVGCDPGYVSRVLGPIGARAKAPELEQPTEPAGSVSGPGEAAAPDLAELALYRLAGMASKLVAIDASGAAWRMPSRAGGWAERVELGEVPPEFALTRLSERDEKQMRPRLLESKTKRGGFR